MRISEVLDARYDAERCTEENGKDNESNHLWEGFVNVAFVAVVDAR